MHSAGKLQTCHMQNKRGQCGTAHLLENQQSFHLHVVYDYGAKTTIATDQRRKGLYILSH